MTAAIPDAGSLTSETVFAHALQGEPCSVQIADQAPVRLPVQDWTRAADPADHLLLRHCAGPTLDVGCGPGRLTAELASGGHLSLGIDVVAEAVRQTRARGASALRRDVFTRVPAEGRWGTALLADGNIGIGGDPAALLRRLRDVIAPDGRIVVEVGAPGTPSGTRATRLACACATSAPFRWAWLGVDALPEVADRAGMVARAVEHYGGRWCAVLGVAP
ncbi:class I SAM-dependent methyltransferase [Nocardioides sambongensis]|uniref:class I SAM-dependent methyltransferase n=1 Tax=Nocardioides sambongensis TaxID=2589074 RepID=UPI0015E8539D|nr:class I SAM-dependent methyltransferase [Nocardioides sambongensis]